MPMSIVRSAFSSSTEKKGWASVGSPPPRETLSIVRKPSVDVVR